MRTRAIAAVALASLVLSTPTASGAVQSSPPKGPVGTVWVCNPLPPMPVVPSPVVVLLELDHVGPSLA